MTETKKLTEAEVKKAEADAIAKAGGKIEGNGLVNPRELKKDDTFSDDDDALISAELMQNIIDTNKRLMSSDVKTKLDAYQAFIKANPDMIIQTHDDFHIQLMMLPGSYRNPEKASEFLNSDFLPGTVMVKNLHDAKAKLRVPFTTAIAIAHYMKKMISEYPEVVAYNVALEREINTRNSDSDVFSLGN